MRQGASLNKAEGVWHRKAVDACAVRSGSRAAGTFYFSTAMHNQVEENKDVSHTNSVCLVGDDPGIQNHERTVALSQREGTSWRDRLRSL